MFLNKLFLNKQENIIHRADSESLSKNTLISAAPFGKNTRNTYVSRSRFTNEIDTEKHEYGDTRVYRGRKTEERIA